MMKCRSCGAVLGSESIVGEWVVCPSCGNRYLLDYADSFEKSQGHIKYYFAAKDTFHDFQTACLDKIMKISPADTISKLTETVKRYCYIPAITNIGGVGDYKLKFLGIESLGLSDAAHEFLQTSISNEDAVFGYSQRKRMPEHSSNFSVVDFDASKLKTMIDSGEVRTNEIYYYPLYQWEFEYQGEKISFVSLGRADDMQYSQLPVEDALKESKRPVYIQPSHMMRYSWTCGTILLLAVVCPVVYFLVADYAAGINGLGPEWTDLNNTVVIGHWWVILLVLLLPIIVLRFVLPLVSALFRSFCQFLGYFTLQLMARAVNLYKKKRYLQIVLPIQKRKQADARNKYGVKLDDLHIQADMPSFYFN